MLFFALVGILSLIPVLIAAAVGAWNGGMILTMSFWRGTFAGALVGAGFGLLGALISGWLRGIADIERFLPTKFGSDVCGLSSFSYLDDALRVRLHQGGSQTNIQSGIALVDFHRVVLQFSLWVVRMVPNSGMDYASYPNPAFRRASESCFRRRSPSSTVRGGGLGQPREPTSGYQVQFCRCRGVGAAPVQSQPVPELPESDFLFVSDAPVCCGFSDCPSPSLFQRPVDCTAVSV